METNNSGHAGSLRQVVPQIVTSWGPSTGPEVWGSCCGMPALLASVASLEGEAAGSSVWTTSHLTLRTLQSEAQWPGPSLACELTECDVEVPRAPHTKTLGGGMGWGSISHLFSVLH